MICVDVAVEACLGTDACLGIWQEVVNFRLKGGDGVV